MPLMADAIAAIAAFGADLPRTLMYCPVLS
jgi:hypothetical protein